MMNTIEIRYIRLQMKRAMKSLPYVLLYMLLMGILTFLLFFTCQKMLSQNGLSGKIDIGIVLPDDDKTADFAVSLVTSMDSVSSMCEFSYVEKGQGITSLENHDIYALVLVPEHFVEDIMTGINTPITIVCQKQKGVEASLFQEFAEMGIDMLGTVQLGIYALEDYCSQDELLNDLSIQINQAINDLYIQYTFSRIDLFKEKELSATGDLSIMEYYICAGIVLLFILSGIPFVSYYAGKEKAFATFCKCRGVNCWKRAIFDFLAVALFWIIVSVAISLCGMKVFQSVIKIFVVLSLTGCSILAFIQLVYALTNGKVEGILFLFFSAIIMLFMAGGFVPLPLLPEYFRTFSFFIPATYWIGLLGEGIRADISLHLLLGNVVLMIFGIIGTGVCEWHRECCEE